MAARRRINISIDLVTHERMCRVGEAYGFKNLCELTRALIHVTLDAIEEREAERCPSPDDDGLYIAEMFDEYANSQRVPDGTLVPKRNYNPREEE